MHTPNNTHNETEKQFDSLNNSRNVHYIEFPKMKILKVIQTM